MPLGLEPGVWTKDLGWAYQEVHHCATRVIVPVVRVFCPYIYGLNDKAVNVIVIKCNCILCDPMQLLWFNAKDRASLSLRARSLRLSTVNHIQLHPLQQSRFDHINWMQPWFIVIAFWRFDTIAPSHLKNIKRRCLHGCGYHGQRSSAFNCIHCRDHNANVISLNAIASNNCKRSNGDVAAMDGQLHSTES